MLKILGAYGISEQIVRTIELIYEGTKAKILSLSGETEFSELLAGAFETLASYIFTILLDDAINKLLKMILRK